MPHACTVCSSCGRVLDVPAQRPRAWLVVDAAGLEALFLERAAAEKAAAARHGVVVPLVTERVA